MVGILKAVVIVCVAFSLINCTHKAKPGKSKSAEFDPSAIPVDPDIYKKVTFVDNSKTQAPYLAMNVDFSSLGDVRKDIEAKEKITLQHRGEAHITVISPPEYEQLKSVLTMELINEVALLNRIQETPFEIVCLGRGRLRADNKTLSTYFIVLDAPGLISLRHTLATLYKTNGGQPNEFKPDEYFPHITIGFNERDLHSQDGVVKDKSSCFSQMQLKAQ